MSFLTFHIWMFCSATSWLFILKTVQRQWKGFKKEEVCARDLDPKSDSVGSGILPFEDMTNIFSLSLSAIMNASKKRAAESDEDERVVDSKGSHGTRQVRSSEDVAQPSSKPGPNVKRSSAQSGAKRKKRAADPTAGGSEVNEKHAEKPKHRIKKLVPPRPFPTVPTSVSATGPRSAHKEGKNYICLTRKTPLGVYLRRCKEVIVKDGCASSCSILVCK